MRAETRPACEVKVAEEHITEKQVSECLGRIRAGRFRSSDIAQTATRAGVKFEQAKLATRLIQQEKKAGRIEKPFGGGPFWDPVYRNFWQPAIDEICCNTDPRQLVKIVTASTEGITVKGLDDEKVFVVVLAKLSPKIAFAS